MATQHGATALAAFRHGRTPFTDFAAAVRLADGLATVEEAKMTGPSAKLAVTGTVDIGTRTLALAAAVARPDDPAPGDRLRVAVSGPFDAPVVVPLPASP